MGGSDRKKRLQCLGTKRSTISPAHVPESGAKMQPEHCAHKDGDVLGAQLANPRKRHLCLIWKIMCLIPRLKLEIARLPHTVKDQISCLKVRLR